MTIGRFLAFCTALLSVAIFALFVYSMIAILFTTPQAPPSLQDMRDGRLGAAMLLGTAAYAWLKIAPGDIKKTAAPE